MSSAGIRAGIYCRISKDRSGLGLGVERQQEDCAALCERRGWTVAGVYVDNDVSASTGKRRPAYQRMLADLEAGSLEAVVVWALDRLHRRPVELEYFLDLVDRRAVMLASVGGNVDLSSYSGRLHARIMGAVARAEVDAKSERTKRAALQAARQGRWRGGSRMFGYGPDGVSVVPEEAAELRRLASAVLAGESLHALARDLRARGARTAAGGEWTYQTLRELLRRPRLAGLSVYRGEVVGPGNWPAILPEDTHRAVRALLDDPARRKVTSNGPRWLLSGLAVCGVCRQPVHTSGARGRIVYRCVGHVARSTEPLDRFVSDLVVARLSQPDAAELLVAKSPDDTAGLHERATALRVQLDEVAGLFADGKVTAAQLATASDRLRAHLADVERHLAEASREPAVAELVRGDARRVWDRLSLVRRRAVVAALLTVVVVPHASRGGTRFRPEAIGITWRAA